MAVELEREENVEQEFNPYEILGLRKWAKPEDIKKAYFSMVKVCSPELHPQRFMNVRKAYDILRQPQRRAEFDILMFNEIPGNMGFKGLNVKTGSVVRLNKSIKELENGGQNGSSIKQMLRLLCERSMVYVNKNYWSEAIADWSRILEIDSANSEARRNIIMAHSRMGYNMAQNSSLDRAIESWKRVLRYKANCVEATHNIAIAYTKLKNIEQERTFWEKTLGLWGAIINRDDKNEYVKNLIVETHKHFGGKFIAKTINRTATGQQQQSTSHPHREVLNNINGVSENQQIGLAFARNEDWPSAVASFEKCLKEQPDNVNIMNDLGKLYLNMGNYNKAFAIWNRALKIDKNCQLTLESLIQGHMMVAKNMREQNAFGPALVHFKKILTLLPDDLKIIMEIGDTYAMKGDNASAITQWEIVLKTDPKNKKAKDAIRKARGNLRS